ncbi:hypothetical protein EG328_004660 [Venturia inaequalis]|uniref:Uncharacterized protein n=1 Tax=Venturia inaequalis TaxID=5025 RepID=A0A8H3YX49_VENIN|nr:hypothetical protein EG328_004660 [Venturia inaequalis]KAE9988624.1 hypothetical protein EG327_003315 [Venturia inaequalis]RDI81802.1 hypothetical protein Vi05172_g8147 [Venturia inaequalis]
MKLTSTLLVAATTLLAPPVSANSYTLCCCTKLTYPQDSMDFRIFYDPRSRDLNIPSKQCDRAATKTIVDIMHGHFAFTTHFWYAQKNVPRYRGDSYIYATAIDGDDNLIGQKEMEGWCAKQKAQRYCWSPGPEDLYDYKGAKLKGTP